MAAEHIETCVNKVSKFRTEFRIISKNISKSMPPEKFENLYAKGNATLLTAIKEYIINANERKSQIRSVEKFSVSSENLYKLKKQSGDTDQMKQAAMFLINEVTRITKELSTEFSKNKDDHVYQMRRLHKEKKICLQIYLSSIKFPTSFKDAWKLYPIVMKTDKML